ncbi:hypothetical protein FACS189490_05310 [Clostridia bacterium]|nr:hypothetical protein FACS189490_05310 [Clostridia bacterium]
MTEIKTTKPYAHKVSLENRERLSLTGITEVLSFDENTVAAATDRENIIIKGEGLKIGAVNVNSGQLDVTGTINSVAYDSSKGFGKNILGKIFK